MITLITAALLLIAAARLLAILMGRRRRRGTRGGIPNAGRRERMEDNTTRGVWDSIARMFGGGDPAPPPPRDVRPAEPATRTDPRMTGLPASAAPIIEAINRLFEDVATHAAGQPVALPLRLEMETMRDVHLPKLARSYVEIPERHRREIYARTGRSASYHLTTSLEAMRARLEEIDRQAASGAVDTFSQNADFINSTYRREADDI